MDVKGEVEQCRSCRQLPHLSFGCEDKYLVGVQSRSYLSQEVASLLFHCAKDFAHLCHPCIEAALTFQALIAEVCSETLFCNLIHALRAYLHLHPLAFFGRHCCV